jgi:heat shock protein HslJ
MTIRTAAPLFFLAGCMAPPEPPIPPGPPAAAYRAVGTEPFWGLSIDERQIVFTRPDAAPLRQPRPKAIIGFAGEIYQTPRIRVNIVHSQCSDGMSDRAYPDKVQVDVDGQRFEGCGGL